MVIHEKKIALLSNHHNWKLLLKHKFSFSFVFHTPLHTNVFVIVSFCNSYGNNSIPKKKSAHVFWSPIPIVCSVNSNEKNRVSRFCFSGQKYVKQFTAVYEGKSVIISVAT